MLDSKAGQALEWTRPDDSVARTHRRSSEHGVSCLAGYELYFFEQVFVIAGFGQFACGHKAYFKLN
jgi:hypothetical protein